MLSNLRFRVLLEHSIPDTTALLSPRQCQQARVIIQRQRTRTMHLTAAICSPSDGRPVCCQPVSLPSLLHCQPKQTSSQHDKEDCRMTWKPTGMTRSSISLTPGPPRGTIYPFWPDVAPHPPSRTSSEEPSPQYHHHCTTGQLPSLCVGLLFRCVRYLLRLATSSHPNPTLVLLPPG